jgi:zinc/manganese transport system ATP-binding protein
MLMVSSLHHPSALIDTGQSPEPIIEARELAIRFGRRTLWKNATFTINAGEFVSVLGPNGAGKSTLLRIVLGLLPASRGTLEVLGTAPRRGQTCIGYVPQRRTLDAHLRVRAWDFVMLGLDGHRWGLPLSFLSRQRQHRLVEEAIEAVGAQSYANRSIGQLSGGEQQRLLLAFALLNQPRLLLLDEPLASLDLRSQQVIAQLVARVARERAMTVVLVTHDINPLLSSTDRVLYVAQGNVMVGTPDEVITTETLSRLYRSPVEVMRDTQGRVLVFGLEQAAPSGMFV